jgi:hypothetical protein
MPEPKEEPTDQEIIVLAQKLVEAVLETGPGPKEGMLAAQMLVAYFGVRLGMSLEDTMVNLAANTPTFYRRWLQTLSKPNLILPIPGEPS